MSIEQDLWRVRQARQRREASSNQEPDPPPEPDPSDLALVLGALEGLQGSLASLPTPQVHIDAPDLESIVTAVNSLKPGATADEIGDAIAPGI